MRGTVLYGPRDIRFEDRETPRIEQPTDAVIRIAATCVCGGLSAKQMGAGRIIAMSRHDTRQTLAREFGATDVVTERGDDGVKRIMDMTNGIGADSVLECVGTQESMMQAIRATRKGGYV